MDDLVSVVVPVYNVYPYLDKCVQSILRQTYEKLEVILVDDGSSDGSGELCELWAKRDSRIVSIRTENKGVGAARNLAIDMAQGHYIAFVDSDDWIEDTFIEKMLETMKHTGADIVSCNVMLYFQNTDTYQKKKIRQRAGIVEGENKKDYITYMPAYFCNKLFKAEIFANRELRFPNHFYEDTALYPMIVASVQKIVHMEDCLYYYLKDRNGSTTNNLSRALDIVKAMKYTLDYFRRQQILEEYKEVLAKYFLARMYRFEALKQQLICSGEGILTEYLGDWKKAWNTKAYIWGSFNARWTAWTINGCNQSVVEHICFNSLISQMLGGTLQCETEGNAFRYEMLKNDFMQGGKEQLKKALKKDINIVIIDLLEERYDILEVSSGCYLTDSEALRNSNIELKVLNRIKAGSEQHRLLWLEACNKWIPILEELDDSLQVVLLKMRLAKGYQKQGEFVLFDGQEQIEQINSMLEKMEKYLLEHCPRIQFWETEDSAYAESDDMQGYGYKPEYLNGVIYKKYAAQIINGSDS